MKKLLIICPEYSKLHGGVAGYVRRLASELSKDMKVDIITSPAKESPHKRINENLLVYCTTGQWNILDFIKILNLIKEKNYEFINLQYAPHMYGWNGVNFSLFLFYLWCFFKKVYIVTYCHEIALPLSLKYWRWIPFSIFNRVMYIFIVFFSKKVGLSVQRWKDISSKVFFWLKEEFLFIPVYSNLKALNLSEKEKSGIRKNLNIAENEIVLFYMGGLHPSKLIYYVLDTVDYLSKRQHKLKLLCAGFETERLFAFTKYKYSYLKDKIILTGSIPEKDLAQLLSISDIYLCPYSDGISAHRTSAMAGLEAGLPVVTTYGKNTDAIFLDNNRALALVKNKKQFLETTEKLAKDNALREQMGHKGQILYNENFDIGKIMDAYKNKFFKK